MCHVPVCGQETFFGLFLPSKLAQWRVTLCFGIYDEKLMRLRQRVGVSKCDPAGVPGADHAGVGPALKRTVTAAELDLREALPALEVSFTIVPDLRIGDELGAQAYACMCAQQASTNNKQAQSIFVDEMGSEPSWDEAMEQQYEYDRKFGWNYEPVAHRTRYFLSSRELARKVEPQAGASTY